MNKIHILITTILLLFGASTGVNAEPKESNVSPFYIKVSLLPKANGGDPDSQYSLGVLYKTGTYFPKDDKEAVKWFRKAAEQGHLEAQFNLGFMYETGDFTLKDDKKSFKWYRKAAEQGLDYAQHKLGDMYSKGKGTLEDN